jgi:hypothetical protein
MKGIDFNLKLDKKRKKMFVTAVLYAENDTTESYDTDFSFPGIDDYCEGKKPDIFLKDTVLNIVYDNLKAIIENFINTEMDKDNTSVKVPRLRLITNIGTFRDIFFKTAQGEYAKKDKFMEFIKNNFDNFSVKIKKPGILKGIEKFLEVK